MARDTAPARSHALDHVTTAPLAPSVNGSTPAPSTDRAADRSRRRRRIVAAGAVAAVGVAAVAVAVVVTRGSSDEPAAESTTGTRTAPVELRDLVVTEEFEGSLGFGDPSPVAAGRSGVVTSTVAAGTEVPAGQQLFSIDLEPTILLQGGIPAFRALDTDTSGPDVQQLEQNLVDLGLGDGVTVDEDFTSATADAVEAWEESLGRDDPDGVVEVGDVVFVDGALRVSAIEAEVSTQVQPGDAVLNATSTAKVVSLDFDAARAGDLEPGSSVGLELPDGTTTTGTLSSVGTEAETDPADPQAEPTVPVIITLTDPAAAAAFDTGSVNVSIERSREVGVDSVPVTALLALAEGGYAVQVVDSSQAAGYRLTAVEIGTVADGYVAITGDGVNVGADVVVPE